VLGSVEPKLFIFKARLVRSRTVPHGMHCIFGTRLVACGSCSVSHCMHSTPVYFDATSRQKSGERIHRRIFGASVA